MKVCDKMLDKGKTPNKLINEKSPYLLQHAYNPVDWYPWCDEAFEKAKEEGKPIFLSIGYSTCHWCHVMAHESFEDEETAKILNEKFISIKVDREERPDIDSIYMRACQMFTGQGGWPLTVFLDSDQKPFYVGTYFPKESRYGKPSFVDVLYQINSYYVNDQDKITEITDEIITELNRSTKLDRDKRLSSDILQVTFKQMMNSFDQEYGGFGHAPKFPTPHMLMFLLKYNSLYKDENSINMVEKTLKAIAEGGINDHIGFGFSRYSVDEMWLVPHFEKMLYDNALLLIAFTEAFQIKGEERYKNECDKIVTFLKRELTDKNGGFFSAIDADSEGIEGKYYVWDYDEIFDLLGEKVGELFCKVYNITENGNFEGKNIPNLIGTNLNQLASSYGITFDELVNTLKESRHILLNKREERVYPHVDDKVLTSWNALMITGLAKAAKVFDNEEYLEMAKDSISFIEKNLIIDDRIMVRYREGEVKNKGYIDDYAYLLFAYLELYEATFVLEYLKKAKNISEKMIDLFWDNENGGFYFYGEESERLIVREKEIYDGAFPSGNSVAAVAMTKLANIIGDEDLLDKVYIMFSTFKKEVELYPLGHTFFLQSIIGENLEKRLMVIIGNKEDPQRVKFLNFIKESYIPNLFVLVTEDPKEFKDIAKFAVNYKIINEKTTVYMCENFICKQPTTDVDKIIKHIKKYKVISSS